MQEQPVAQGIEQSPRRSPTVTPVHATRANRMKTIGILGGLGPESTAACYLAITRAYYERCHDYAYPPIVVCSVSFQEYIDAEYEAPNQVCAALECLHRGGADFAVAACNSIHVVHETVRTRAALPWISIMDATAEAIRHRGWDRVGLLGTVFTMSRAFYQRAFSGHGITTLVPPPAAQQAINTLIFDELVRAITTEAAKRSVQASIDELAARGAQAIVLGCTELPFLIGPDDSPLPVLNTTEILARKALDLALA